MVVYLHIQLAVRYYLFQNLHHFQTQSTNYAKNLPNLAKKIKIKQVTVLSLRTAAKAKIAKYKKVFQSKCQPPACQQYRLLNIKFEHDWEPEPCTEEELRPGPCTRTLKYIPWMTARKTQMKKLDSRDFLAVSKSDKSLRKLLLSLRVNVPKYLALF